MKFRIKKISNKFDYESYGRYVAQYKKFLFWKTYGNRLGPLEFTLPETALNALYSKFGYENVVDNVKFVG